MADETFDEDIFDDLYDEPEEPAKPAPAPAAPAAPADPEPVARNEHAVDPAAAAPGSFDGHAVQDEYAPVDGDAQMAGSNFAAAANQGSGNEPTVDDNYGPINVKEDGKMFIGGLNWETTEQSLKDYFSQFGEVSECTVMRDSATGRSRGFGFLTFKDPKCVNTVMVKEHYLDGKIIDPKRAIPREEQERTSKIFVGGVSQEATEEDFKNFFKQFGRVVDATLMMDKDTGRPRGFGFVTFDGDAAVDACLQGPLQILGKPIEVKRAQPRGNMREEEDNKKFGRGGKFGGRNDQGNNSGGAGDFNQNNMGANGQNAGMTPAMMAQYWQRMQLYFRQMQQNLAAQNGSMPNAMGGMPGMNPQMMGMMANGGGPMGGMNPQMMSQMGMMGGNMSPGQNMANQPTNFGNNQAIMGGGEQRQGGPGYTAQEQLMFEQQKYQQQEARRMQQQAGFGGQGGPTSWEGMYDDIPQPGVPSGPGAQRMHGGKFNNRARQGSSQPPSGPSNAPANAPTGPKNAGKPGANYRGGGRNANYRHNPYGGGRG